jgi:hypothetical protein
MVLPKIGLLKTTVNQKNIFNINKSEYQTTKPAMIFNQSNFSRD